MISTPRWFKLVVAGVASCGLVDTLSWGGAPYVKYASSMGEEKWHMTGNRLRCGLSLIIPNYGVGYFEQYATKNPHFILRKWDQVPQRIPATVLAISPVWKPFGRSFAVGKTFVKPGEYGFFLKRDYALKLLTFLSQGYQAIFNYRSELGFPTTVSLSPVHFRSGYADYQRCLANLLPFNFDAVKESVFHFTTDGRSLSDNDKAQLRRIAEYVAADNQIETVRILGYTDASGRRGYNNAISQLRAKTIQNYLLGLGVPKKKLFATWFGSEDPIARNDTEDGRAENRRAVVSLIKK